MQNEQLEPFAISITVNPMQQLQQLTQQELDKLQRNKQTMQTVHSNLDLLIKRYNLEKSYFGQAASWYGAKPWWVKLILLIFIAGVFAAIGMLCHLPITLALVSSAIYISLAFFLINHHQVTVKQTKLLCEDILELEKSLTETINHFNELSNSLQTITKSMHELNSQFLDDMQSLQNSVAELNKQVKHYKQLISELKTAQQTISLSTQKTTASLDAGREQYQECCGLISAQNQELNTICQAIGSSSQSLNTDSESLRSLTAKYQIAITEMQTSTNKVLAFMDKLKPTKASHSKLHARQTTETITRLSIEHQRIDCVDEDESLRVLKDAKQARTQSSLVLERINKTTKDLDYIPLI